MLILFLISCILNRILYGVASSQRFILYTNIPISFSFSLKGASIAIQISLAVFHTIEFLRDVRFVHPRAIELHVKSEAIRINLSVHRYSLARPWGTDSHRLIQQRVIPHFAESAKREGQILSALCTVSLRPSLSLSPCPSSLSYHADISDKHARRKSSLEDPSSCCPSRPLSGAYRGETDRWVDVGITRREGSILRLNVSG